jgi:hypothetical protein
LVMLSVLAFGWLNETVPFDTVAPEGLACAVQPNANSSSAVTSRLHGYKFILKFRSSKWRASVPSVQLLTPVAL